MARSESQELWIGAWRADPAVDEISRGGKTVKLEPRTMRVLVCLAEHAGHVVSVEQLLDAVWPDVVVTPDSVYQAVAALRRALGDDPKEPAYIANVLRRGYRLIASVDAPALVADPTASAESMPPDSERLRATPPAPVPTASVHRPTRRWPIQALSVAAVLALGIVASTSLWQQQPRTTAGRETRAAAAHAQGNSVAVLPFLDMSEQKDQGYFADGLSAELIDQFTKIPGLRVPATTSSFYFKGKQVTVAEIGKALAVDHVLEGSVRKAGATIRITAQLVRADTGYHVWSQTYDRPLKDVFKIQDEIASNVVRALKVSLLDPPAPSPTRTVNAEAYTLYLKARSTVRGAGEGDFIETADLLKRALTLDPNFAAAWAELAGDLTGDLGWHQESGDKELCGRAREAAGHALALDPTLSGGHRSNAAVLTWCDADLKAGEAEIKRALELDPGDAMTWRVYAWIAMADNRQDEAERFAQESVSRDPLNAWNYYPLAWAQGNLGKFADAEASYRKAIELNPTAAGLHALHANSLLALERPADALAELQHENDDQFRQMTLPLVLDALGRRKDAEHEIAVFVLKYSAIDPVTVAEFYACRKDAGHAVLWLGHLSAEPQPYDDVPNRIACFRNIKGDPGYQLLLLKWRRAKARVT
jgi:TolB-like protein/DNA-binding winged helix-turn-helix (wHTH) protein/Tfp pilus assembly protein PilF